MTDGLGLYIMNRFRQIEASRNAGVVELVDTRDLKSLAAQAACGFKTRPRQNPIFYFDKSAAKSGVATMTRIILNT